MTLLTIRQQAVVDFRSDDMLVSEAVRRSFPFAFFAVKTFFFALNHSKGQSSSVGRGAGRINACGCPPAPLAPTTGKCDCLWYDSSADQQVTRHRMQDD